MTNAPARIASRGRLQRLWRDPALWHSVSRVAALRISLGLLAWMALRYGTFVHSTPAGLQAFIPAPHTLDSAVWGSWQRWDALRYDDIAQNGYSDPRNVVFWPLFPLLQRVVSYVTPGGVAPAGLVVSTLSLIAALVLLQKLVERDVDHATADRAVFYLVLFPTAVFLFAGYTESLFLALVLGTFLAARQRRFVVAGCIAALAAACRFQGVILVAPLAVEMWSDRRARRARGVDRIRRAYAIALLPIVVAASWSLYVAIGLGINGGPMGAEHDLWNNYVVWPWQSVADMVRTIAQSGHPSAYMASVVDLVMLGLTLLSLPFIWKRLPLSYFVYTALSLVPMLTREAAGRPVSTSRFLLAVFPLFVVAAMWGRKPWLDRTIVMLSAPLMALGVFAFAQQDWVG